MEITEARWHIAGGHGMLATDIIAALRTRGVEPVVTDRDDLDITSPAQVARGFADADIVVNCAAYTAVDAAEEDEATAFSINATGPGVIARACSEMGLRMIHLSTDYVFSGTAERPYSEDARLNPQGAYGRTKAAGEAQVRASDADALIVRTAWLYGRGGPCFPKTIARLGRERGALEVVNDQVGQPTWTRDLADLILRLVEAEAPAGIYHGTSTGQTSWFDFAREVVAAAGLGDIVSPTSAADQKRLAPRPAYSVLGHDTLTAIGVEPIGDWRERWRLAAPEVLADVVG
jgi:dTDP-4-dehydrorhamnose reductase